MKRLIFTLIVLALMATPVVAAPTLGWWDSTHPGTIYATWDFTDAEPVLDGPTYKYMEGPDTNATGGKAWIGDPTTTSYDFGIDAIVDPTEIVVFIELQNFPELRAYKEIWVDVEYSGTLIDIAAYGDTTGVTHTTVDLSPPVPGNPNSTADFGFRITPNPWKEDIFFTILAPVGTAGLKAELYSIRIDTICIPAPGAIILGSLGVGLVGWLRRRKSL